VAYITCVLYLETTYEPAYHNTQPVSHCPYFLTPRSTLGQSYNTTSGIFCLGGMTYTPFNDDDNDAYRPELRD
jgi:hypothetical protein